MIHPNPFATIWMHPRVTIRRIVSQNPKLFVILLACLAGIGRALDRASMRNAGDHISTEWILLLSFTVGPLGGLFGLWLSSHLLKLTGTWLGGIAPRQHIKAAVIWGSVPAVFALLIWLPELLIFGSGMFRSESPAIEAHSILLIAFSVIEIALSVWSLILICHTVAEVQSYQSAWRGLVNLALAACVISVPIIFAAVLVVILS